MLPSQQQNGEIFDSQTKKTPSLWFSKRFLVAIMLFLGYSNVSMGSNNINIAVIEMASDKLITEGNLTTKQPAAFQWDPATVGVISSMHSYAGLLSFGGVYFANKLGGLKSGALTLIAAGILTILTQATLYFNFYLFLIGRFLIGLFVFFYMVTTADVYSKWFPKKERSTLISFCNAGTGIGLVFTNSCFGYIAHYWGWQMVFYVSGTISVVFSILCLIIVKDRPSRDKWISKEEQEYIIEETNTTNAFQRQVSHPYKKILLSAPVLALCFGKFAFSWIDKLLSIVLPQYVKDMTNKNTKETGLISTIPVFAAVVVRPLCGLLMDYWKNHTTIGLTKMHKLITCISFLTASGLFFITVFYSNFTISIGIFALVPVIMATVGVIFEVLPVTIAPKNASVVAGLATLNTASSTIALRTITGFMTMNHTVQEWNNCFILAGAVLISGTVVFLKYGSSEAQTWSLKNEQEHCCDEKIKNQP